MVTVGSPTNRDYGSSRSLPPEQQHIAPSGGGRSCASTLIASHPTEGRGRDRRVCGMEEAAAVLVLPPPSYDEAMSTSLPCVHQGPDSEPQVKKILVPYKMV